MTETEDFKLASTILDLLRAAFEQDFNRVKSSFWPELRKKALDEALQQWTNDQLSTDYPEFAREVLHRLQALQ